MSNRTPDAFYANLQAAAEASEQPPEPEPDTEEEIDFSDVAPGVAVDLPAFAAWAADATEPDEVAYAVHMAGCILGTRGMHWNAYCKAAGIRPQVRETVGEAARKHDLDRLAKLAWSMFEPVDR